MKGQQSGWLLALLATLIYSTNAPLARGAILAGMAPTTLVGARFVVGSLLFALTLWLTTVGSARGEQQPLDKRGTLLALAAGGLNGFGLLASTWGLVDLSASIATLLSIALTPLFVIGLLRWRGERSSPRDWLRLGIGLVGLYFLVGFDGTASGRGLFFTIIGTALYALHMVMVQWYLRPYNTWAVTGLLVFGATAPALVLWWQAGGSVYVPGVVGWSAILVQGLLATYVARLCIYAAVNRLGSAQLALLTPLEAALTVLLAMIWLSEAVTGRQWLGIALILASALLVVVPVTILRPALQWRRPARD